MTFLRNPKKPIEDISGITVGRLYVNNFVGVSKHGESVYQCLCDCGNSKQVTRGNLLKKSPNKTLSCGCLRQERKTKHGLSHLPEYQVWHHMKRRCLDSNFPGFHNYGGRGIQVCPRWQDNFEAFLADVGRRPARGFDLDRINNDGDYEPENCRWVTKPTNCNNTRVNKFIEHRGKRQTIAQWAKELGLNSCTIAKRLRRGHSTERALSTKMGPSRWQKSRE